MTDKSIIEVPVFDVNGGGPVTRLDKLAIEEPLEIRVGGRSVSITMRTPGNDHELAVGFLFGEGLIRNRSQVRFVETEPVDGVVQKNVVSLVVANEVAYEIEKLDRHFYTTSSCGVCGKASIDAVGVYPDDLIRSEMQVESGVIRSLPSRLKSAQDVFRETGGLHAAALFEPDGTLVDIREDVGRHNAMDKLIGARVLDDLVPVEDKIVLVSGRASFELVQKAVMAEIPVMAAVGAPSSLAVELASWFGMTLIGFLREDTFNVYTKPKRILHGQ